MDFRELKRRRRTLERQAMTKREIIIVSVMILAVIYGVYSFFFSAPAGKPGPVKTAEVNLEELNRIAAEVRNILADVPSDKRDAYIVARAESEWLVDPLYLSRDFQALVREGENVQLFYTGFIEVGNRRIAVINGLDYEVGDHLLERPGFRVRSIRPEEVVITDGRGVAGIPIPFVDLSAE